MGLLHLPVRFAGITGNPESRKWANFLFDNLCAFRYC